MNENIERHNFTNILLLNGFEMVDTNTYILEKHFNKTPTPYIIEHVIKFNFEFDNFDYKELKNKVAILSTIFTRNFEEFITFLNKRNVLPNLNKKSDLQNINENNFFETLLFNSFTLQKSGYKLSLINSSTNSFITADFTFRTFYYSITSKVTGHIIYSIQTDDFEEFLVFITKRELLKKLSKDPFGLIALIDNAIKMKYTNNITQ